jgi:hypothetical protein
LPVQVWLVTNGVPGEGLWMSRGYERSLQERESDFQTIFQTYATWARLFELLRYYSWIVDRFHVSTQAYQQHEFGRVYDFDWLEQRLLELGFRHVLCVRSPATFGPALEARLRVSGNPAQYGDPGEFIAEQQRIRALVTRSRLPYLELDVSGGDLAALANQVADWLESTGGLCAPD